MRERLAMAVAILTVLGLMGLSVLFARAQNPPVSHLVASEPGMADTLRARFLFGELGCTACHSVGDLGNPSNPLDGVGSRRSPASIRAWTIGEGPVADSMSAAVLRIKGSYVEVPDEDMDLLVDWLAGLKGGA